MRLALLTLAVSSSALAAPPEFHDAVASDEPILWYQLGEADGTIASNTGSLGTDFDGTYVNGVALGAPTIAGDDGACFTAPLLQHVEMMSPSPDFLTGNPSFTAEALVKVFEGPQDQNLWAPFLHWGLEGTGNSVYFSLSHTQPNRAFVGFYNAGLRMVDTFEQGEWVHFVWVRDSAGGTNDSLTGSTLYVNGVPVELEPDTQLCCNGAMPEVDEGPIRIQRADNGTRYFNGDIDEVVLYDRLLEPDEIAEHYETLLVDAPCTADCDGNGVLNILDFVCFQGLFVAGDVRADCDRSACADLNILDFVCYQQQFLAGCP